MSHGRHVPQLKTFEITWIMLVIALISGVTFAVGLFMMDIWHIHKSIPGLSLTEDTLATFTGASMVICLICTTLYVVLPNK
ncbi:hypothetical protein [Vibrio ishigakensis]|uniref:hypothetical protein n=1 Tax=Vibrio ishigakensis TaxID=1481914 RepID=UPI0021C3366A|nr:hypothetical protein [Vibrio ishigakensis]